MKGEKQSKVKPQKVQAGRHEIPTKMQREKEKEKRNPK